MSMFSSIPGVVLSRFSSAYSQVSQALEGSMKRIQYTATEIIHSAHSSLSFLTAAALGWHLKKTQYVVEESSWLSLGEAIKKKEWILVKTILAGVPEWAFSFGIFYHCLSAAEQGDITALIIYRDAYRQRWGTKEKAQLLNLLLLTAAEKHHSEAVWEILQFKTDWDPFTLGQVVGRGVDLRALAQTKSPSEQKFFGQYGNPSPEENKAPESEKVEEKGPEVQAFRQESDSSVTATE